MKMIHLTSMTGYGHLSGWIQTKARLEKLGHLREQMVRKSNCLKLFIF